LAARSAAKLPVGYGSQIDNLRAALDWALSPGGDLSVGVALTAAAVPLWMQLSLIEECRRRVERAIAALGNGAHRDARREMKLHAALGESLVIPEGAAGSETGAAWTKALEIAERLDDAEYRLRSLWGLWLFHSSSGEYRVALTLAQRFCTLAANHPDPSERLIGERMIGAPLFYLGDLLASRCHIERVFADYVGSDHRSRIIPFQVAIRHGMR
jgi:hypothetical protein